MIRRRIFLKFVLPVLLTGMMAGMAGIGSARAAAGFDWNAPDRGAVSELLILNRLESLVTNTGDSPDVFHVSMVRFLPENWVGTLCAGILCYPPFILEIDLPLDPGESINLDIDLTALGIPGAGTCDITVASTNDPGLEQTLTFALASSELDVLLIAADGGDGSVAFFAEALIASGRTHGVWNLTAVDLPSSTDLGAFDAVVWAGGTASGLLDDAIRTDLAFYISGGGNLLLSGQNLAYDYNDPASPWYSTEALAWFQGVLGTGYVADDAGLATVSGISGDLIGDGLSFTLGGGDGADQHQGPDQIAPLGAAMPSFQYAPDIVAGVRYLFAAGRTCHLGFGFENISTAADRDAVMLAVLDWFAGIASSVGPSDTPRWASRPAAVPNPFNPQTELRLNIGGDLSVHVGISIHDVRGRLVRELYDGTMPPGPAAFLWNGRDDLGRRLSSGLYLARIRLDQSTRTLKMTLVE